MSVRASASLPSTCSGAMYCSVPSIVPCAVTSSRVCCARERFRLVRCRPLRQAEVEELGMSRPFVRLCRARSLPPSRDSMMLAGLRSRCTMFWRCALSSASISPRPPQRFVDRQRAVRDSCRQRLSLDVLHDEEADVRPVRRRRAACRCSGGSARRSSALRDRSALHVGVVGEMRRQHLDGHRAVQPGVGGLVDLAHSACADGRRSRRDPTDCRREEPSWRCRETGRI